MVLQKILVLKLEFQARFNFRFNSGAPIALGAFCLDQDTLILQLANIIKKCVYSALTDKRDKNEQPQIK